MEPVRENPMSRRSRFAGACVVCLALSVAAAWAQPARPAEPGADEADITATGQGGARAGLAPAQARLMAERAAHVVATRNLARKIFGQEVQLDETGSGTGALEVFLKGVRQVSSTPVEGGQYEVTVGIPLREMGKTVTGIWEENRTLPRRERGAAPLAERDAGAASGRPGGPGQGDARPPRASPRTTRASWRWPTRPRPGCGPPSESCAAQARIAELEAAQTRPASS